jgi:hypothetical protein
MTVPAAVAIDHAAVPVMREALDFMRLLCTAEAI